MNESLVPEHAWDLPVYRQMLDACFQTLSTLIPSLPDDAAPHLLAGLTRSCQRVPDLIALGVATWRSVTRFPYLDLAGRECHDMIQRLRYCQQTHLEYLDVTLCNRLIDSYRAAVKELRTLTTADRSAPAATAEPESTTPSQSTPARRSPQGRLTLGMGMSV